MRLSGHVLGARQVNRVTTYSIKFRVGAYRSFAATQQKAELHNTFTLSLVYL